MDSLKHNNYYRYQFFQKHNSLESVAEISNQSIPAIETVETNNRQFYADTKFEDGNAITDMCQREENVIETFNMMMKKKQNETSVVILDSEVGESNTDEVISCSYSPEGVDPAPLPGDYIETKTKTTGQE